MISFAKPCSRFCTPPSQSWCRSCTAGPPAFMRHKGQWAEAITHALAAADFSTAARLMEQTVEQFWVHGEAATMARWVLALPEVLVREHARLVLTTALYLLTTVVQTTEEQRARVHQQVRQLMARVETALQPQADETNQEISAHRRRLPPSLRASGGPRRRGGPAACGVCACSAGCWP